MQFQIPQFIETEDKVVGPFTLKQFIYVGFAGGGSAILYFLVDTFAWILLSIPLLGLGILLAFLRVNGRPLAEVVISAMSFYWKPQKYVWHPENPALKKDVSAVQSLLGASASLENLVAGIALRSAWGALQTGSKKPAEEAKRRSSAKIREQYELIHHPAGDRTLVKRIDYR